MLENLATRLDGPASAPIAVALSGGGDSLALLILVLEFAGQAGRSVTALTMDHQLNPASSDWTLRARDMAQGLGARWQGLRWEGEKPAHGLPAAARAARHALLAEATRNLGASVLLMGHTADDLAEAALMRASDTPVLAAPRDWSPSPAWPQGREVFLFRPLLSARRQDLRVALVALGQTWIDDPANDDPRFARSRARAKLGGGLTGETGAALPDIAPLARRVEISHTGEAFLPWDLLRDTLARPADAKRLLAAALLCVSGGATPPRGPRLNRLVERLAAGEAFTATLSGTKVVATESGALLVREAGDRRAAIRNDPGVFDGRFEVLRGQIDGPLAGRAARLSGADRATLQRLPAAVRPSLPVMIDSDGAPHLPRLQGHEAGDANVRCLVRARFAAACGLVNRESEIASGTVT